MVSEQLHLTKLLETICRVLNVFNFPIGSSIIQRAATNRDNESNNTQLLANLKQELMQLPSLTSIDIHGEMRCFILSLIESIKATNVIDKKFITRSITKIYRGFEPFARNEAQYTALIEMEIAKEDALGIEQRHRVAHKLKAQRDEYPLWQKEENNEELHMTRVLQAATD
ncbi:unnamed protein product [Adineta steineri]|uniref:Uncharacterized protein n=1 Tax=Adineta steineri TaxID=433720 RepID=A0A814LR47_9BILA|nr:unnamed protein product [Adineta steineri]CAF3832187.1 unnamed protein product [Adineta steineri]